jgi:hypothetical protein
VSIVARSIDAGSIATETIVTRYNVAELTNALFRGSYLLIPLLQIPLM